MSEKRLPAPGDELRVTADVTLIYSRLDVNQTNTTVLDMTPVAAEAAKEIARFTSAVPAEEKTKQEMVRVKHETLRYGIAAVCVLAGIVVAGVVPAASWPIGLIVTVLGGGAVAPTIIDRLKAPRGPQS